MASRTDEFRTGYCRWTSWARRRATTTFYEFNQERGRLITGICSAAGSWQHHCNITSSAKCTESQRSNIWKLIDISPSTQTPRLPTMGSRLTWFALSWTFFSGMCRAWLGEQHNLKPVLFVFSCMWQLCIRMQTSWLRLDICSREFNWWSPGIWMYKQCNFYGVDTLDE